MGAPLAAGFGEGLAGGTSLGKMVLEIAPQLKTGSFQGVGQDAAKEFAHFFREGLHQIGEMRDAGGQAAQALMGGSPGAGTRAAGAPEGGRGPRSLPAQHDPARLSRRVPPPRPGLGASDRAAGGLPSHAQELPMNLNESTRRTWAS
jgi:hypothetical protein